MPTHAAVAGFDLAAEAYERGRPGYPAEAIAYLRETLGLGPGRRIVDLGAGTGKFTRAMAGTGATVVPVDPTRAMRLVLHRLDPGAPVLAAVSERLPLRTGSVDGVVAGQAFHWFASSGTVDEIVRVLRPGGGIGLVWNTRDESLPWTAKLGALINAHETGTPKYKGTGWQRVFEGRPDLTPLEHRAFVHAQRLDVETLVDRVLSVSFIALLSPAEREELAAEVRTLIATDPATRDRPALELPYRTDVYTTRRLPGVDRGDPAAP